MKNSWLRIGMLLLLQVWMNSFWLCICLCLLYAVWMYKKKFSILIMIALSMLLYLRSMPSPHELPQGRVAKIVDLRSNYAIALVDNQRVILYEAGDVNFDDIIEFEGEVQVIDGIQNFYAFHFPTWANRHGMQYSITISKHKVVQQGTTPRSKLYQYINSIEDEGKSKWIKHTLYGIQSEEDEDLSYLVASSGMHLSWLAYLLQSLLEMWVSTLYAALISLLGIAFLAYSTIMKDSLCRILTFRLVSLFTKKLTNKDRLGISLVVMLLWKPYMAFELALLLPLAFRFLQLFNVQKVPRLLCSFFVLLPIQFYFFSCFDALQILLFRLYRYGYGICYLLAWLSLWIPTTLCFRIAMFFQTMLNEMSNLQLLIYAHPPLLWLIAWFIFVSLYISYKRRKDILCLALLVCYLPLQAYCNPFLEIVMLDVGQGDCTLISLPFNQGNILIDVAGNINKNIPEDIIVPYLRSRGIYALDKVIITHDDFDHSGGLPQLQAIMDIEEVITTKQVKISIADTTLQVLLANEIYEDKNENSLVILLEAYGLRTLFMGDAGAPVEQQLMATYPKLQADILKVGHHGSKSSSTLPFIHQMHPTLALISCGRHNFYGHPSPETIKNLQQEQVSILSTPTNGAIVIKMNNFLRFYKTVGNEFGIIKNR